ncbi:restriction endonuclease subunit S [Perlucidibaca aquatica]|uniref:restriction endonuclease subunit S n=1 Tax=Perlucidibaca aquatica TaxID=1852776 RepID=UPI00083B219A|nr:restriction endonuclease subunit S [Perlucidibaca aquatica]
MSWPNFKIGDLCTLMTGGTPSTSRPEYYEEGTVPWIVSGDIHKKEISDCEKRITGLAVKESNARYLPRDSVLIALNGQGKTRGTVALLRMEGATCNQSIVSINPNDKQELSSDYLFHYLNSQYQNIRNITGDKDRAGLNMPLIREITIPLPPLPEQKRIAAILDKADAIRRKRQHAIQLAEDFLRAVFLDIFGDPVTNPKGFKKGSITELADIITGHAFKSDEYVSDSDVAVRLCRGTNVLTSYFDWSDTAYWPKDQLAGLEKYLLLSNDIVLAMDRPWISSGLKVCIFSEQEVDTYLVQRVARLRPKEAIFSEYIYSCIKSQAFASHCCPTETTVPHISPVELRGYEVLIPDKKTIYNYHVIVGKIKSAITGMKEAASYAGITFYSLSQKAFAGQL